MNKSNFQITNRIVSLILAIVFVLGVMPISSIASTVVNPNAYTVTVKDESSNSISGAKINYVIYVDEVAKNDGGEITEDGEAVISSMSSYKDDVDAGNGVKVKITASKDGYETITKTYTVSDATDNINITMHAVKITESTVTVNKTGEGTVKLNDNAVKTLTVKKGSTVDISIVPENGSYISNVVIDGVKKEIKDKSNFTDSVIVNDDVVVVYVTFTKTYSVSYVSHTGVEKVTINNKEDKSQCFDAGTEITVKITISDEYVCKGIYVNGDKYNVVSDDGAYTYTIKSIDKDLKIEPSVALKQYIVRVVSDNGEITIIKPDNIKQGVVTANVQHNSDLVFSVAPSKGYHLDSVKIKYEDNTSKNIENIKQANGDKNENAVITVKEITENQDIVITITSNIYSVTTEEVEHGKITADKSKVEYNNSVDFTIAPDSGYMIKEFYINGNLANEYSGFCYINNENEDGTVTFKVEKVSEDIKVSAVTVENTELKFDDVINFNKEDAINTYNNSVYVYKNNGKVTFETKNASKYTKIKVNGKIINNNTITSTTIITELEVCENYKFLMFFSVNHWRKVSLPNGGLKIVIDNTKPQSTIKPDDANVYGYYNKDVNVTIAAEDINAKITENKKEFEIDNSYSGIQKIEYWVECDNVLTQGKGCNNNGETDKGIIYENENNAIISKPDPKSITVDTSNGKNNSDNVVLYVKVTDRAGNESEQKIDLKICTTNPGVSISMSGTKNDETNKGYFTSRTATVTIKDRASCFDESLANGEIIIKGKDGRLINTAQMITWIRDGNVATGTINFLQENDYEWSIEYKNKADLINENPSIKDEDGSTYKFTVDKTSPNATVSIESDSWDSLLSTITFGIWKKSAVTVTTEANDSLSGVSNILYYKTSSETALKKEELDNLYKNGKFVKDEYSFPSEEQFVVYSRIMDKAGNVKYIGTNGVIIDMTASDITISPESSNSNNFYNSDVKVEISVNEPGTVNSGIKKISYEVIKNYTVINDEISGDKTQSGVLYNYNFVADKVTPGYGKLEITDWNGDDQTNTTNTFEGELPQKEDLKTDWKNYIIVDSTKNNADKVLVVVTTVDNAGNISKKISDNIAINITKPEVKISFDNNEPNKIVGDRGYFGGENAQRTATITINDRASCFDDEAATNGVVIDSAEDSKNEDIKSSVKLDISKWSTEGDTHKATVKFIDDANYIWSYSYNDKADNIATKENNNVSVLDATVTPYVFTIDKTNPFGAITIDDNSYTNVINTLTYGGFKLLFKNTSLTLKYSSNDVTSPITTEFYKTDDITEKSANDLDALEFDYKIENNQRIDPNEQLVIYERITDDAGNRSYIRSDGHIVDDVKSNIVLEAEDTSEENNKVIYGLSYAENNGSVDVKVDVKDDKPYSGISTVDYWIEKDGNKTKDNTNLIKNSYPDNQEELDNCSTYNGEINVDPQVNNSSNVLVCVKTIDNAGNENSSSVPLDIDVTAPKIKVTYNDKKNENAKEGYFTSRKATVVITERTNHFDVAKATNGIKIEAVDAEGHEITDLDSAYTISEWITKEGATPDEATHTATITYNADANYKFSIKYTDEANNENETPDVSKQETPYEFTVDATRPTGSLTAKSADSSVHTWENPIDKNSDPLVFGFWSNKKISISGTSNDATSPIANVEYYIYYAKNASDNTNALTRDELNKITDFNSFDGFDVTDNKQFAVYIRITDCAGNYEYFGTDGLIVDNKHPQETIAPEISVEPEKPIRGIYKGDVKVDIKVEDPTVGGTYSGLKEVTYAIYDRASKTPDVPTQEGTLCSFEIKSPKQSDLIKSIDKTITVNSKKNNSNNIQIVVYAKDNAGNAINNADKASNAYTVIKVDITAPVIDISYDNNNADSKKYFKSKRVAKIKITERNFDSKDVKVKVTNTDKTIPAVVGWKTVKGNNNLDNSIHIATITYFADGDYTFSIAYTDIAGNKCKSINYANGTVAGINFTVDKTIPTINVAYNNNSAQNINYYKNARTATLTVKEHNFDESRVKISMTANDDGKSISTPRVSGWRSVGNNNVATISYQSDAKYTFEMSFTDKAGNKAAPFAKQTFYVDKTAPVLSINGIKNESANKGKVFPIVSYSDTNYDSDKVKITLVGANRGNVALIGNYGNAKNGRSFYFANFAKKNNVDDIYTLSASLTDKAGNSTSKVIRFSVNRFGSVYSLNKSSQQLNGSYVKFPRDIIVTEKNADPLKNIVLTVFKNQSNSYVLRKDKDYKVDVSGGNGRWYSYVYTVYKENFADDGNYELTIKSQDKAGNVAVNTLDTKTTNIVFGVDKTEPIVNILNAESKKTYAVDDLEISVNVDDNLKLKAVVAYLDGKEYKTWSEDEVKEKLSLDISGNSTNAHELKFIAVDAAGNKYEQMVSNFYVTTNLWVRYYTNKPLFFGSIALLIAIAGVVVFLIIREKKKREDF